MRDENKATFIFTAVHFMLLETESLEVITCFSVCKMEVLHDEQLLVEKNLNLGEILWY